MKHTIELQPFTVPNFVRQVMPVGRRKEGWKEAPAIPLAELSPETLEAMCSEFCRAVFEKAGKMTPNAEPSRWSILVMHDFKTSLKRG